MTLATNVVGSESFTVTCYLAGDLLNGTIEVSKVSENPNIPSDVTFSKPFAFEVAENCGYDNMYIIPVTPLASYQFYKPRGLPYTFSTADNFGSVADYIGVRSGYSCLPSACELVDTNNVTIPDVNYDPFAHAYDWAPPINTSVDMEARVKCAKDNGEYLFSHPITMSFPICSELS